MKKLLIANWKMNPPSLKEAKDLFVDYKKGLGNIRGVDVVIAPPSVFISDLKKIYSGNRMQFSTQDIFWEDKGSFTGEVGVSQLKSVGVNHVIVGHSERRSLGETDDEVSRKALSSAKGGMRVILCVGEEERDPLGKYLSVLEDQIRNSLKGFPKSRVSNLIVAYEPVWAIGKTASDAVDNSELHAMSIFIRKVLVSIFGKKKAFNIPILYGGSVEPSNAEALASSGVDGFLVGHASLKIKHFSSIAKALAKS